jgi:Xaa-Pro aminopeptidase
MTRRLRNLILIYLTLLIALPAVAQEAMPPAEPFAASVYRERREKLMDQMEDGVAVLYARGEEDRDGFLQDGNFFYLTGISEPGAILLLAPGQRLYRHRLYLSPRNPEAERWVGEREPLGAAMLEATGFDRVRRTNSLNSDLVQILEATSTLHLISLPARPSQPVSEEKELYGKLSARIPGLSIENSTKLLPAMRSIKEERELEYMGKAIEATISAQRAAARAIRPGVEENWVESLIVTEFKRGGAVRPAFSSIVGAGDNSTILHYPDHDETIASGALVVVDIGSDYGHYAADITRTYPADGRFTTDQREIYEIVLRIQGQIIEMIKPGVYLEDLQARAVELMSEAGYADYYLHGVSHWVGLDVHDVGVRSEPLAENMVITVEPGIYIAEKKLGIRIEDQVLITGSRTRVLTGALPRDVTGVEALMRGE